MLVRETGNENNGSRRRHSRLDDDMHINHQPNDVDGGAPLQKKKPTETNKKFGDFDPVTTELCAG